MNQKVTKSDFQSHFFMPRIIQIFYFVAIIFGKLNLRNSLFLMEKSILKIFGSVDVTITQQRPRADLNKRFLPRAKTTTA